MASTSNTPNVGLETAFHLKRTIPVSWDYEQINADQERLESIYRGTIT